MDDEKYLYTLSPMTDDDIIAQAKGKEVLNEGNYFLRAKEPKPIAGGLYDPAIFGRIGRCECGLTRLPRGTNEVKTCPNCKTIVFANPEDYMRNMAYYRLSIPIIFPYKVDKFWNELHALRLPPYRPTYQTSEGKDKKYSSSQWYQKLILLWNTAWEIVPKDDRLLSITTPEGEEKSLRISEVVHDTPRECIGLVGLFNLQGCTYRGQVLDFKKYLNTCFPIISVHFRPSSFQRGVLQYDKRTIMYSAIIQLSKNINYFAVNFLEDSVDIATMMHNLNMLICIDTNESELLKTGKYHTIRDNTRQRVKRSGRANIFPALDLDMNHVYIPRSLAYKCLDGDIIKSLGETYGQTDARKMYETQDPKAIEVFKELIDKSMVILLRQPVLHKFSIVALHPVLTDEPGIGIPIEICEPLNADFDGDQVPFWLITDDSIVAELNANLTPQNLWFYEKNDKPVFTPRHEILFGLYKATKMGGVKDPDNIPEFVSFEALETAWKTGKIEYDEIVKCDDKLTTYGRSKVEKILGKNLSSALDEPRLGKTNVPISSGNVGKIIAGLQYNPRRGEIVHELINFASEITTHEGISSPPFKEIYDFNDPKIQEIIDSKDSTENKYTKLNKYIEGKVKETIQNLPDNNIMDIINSGARVKMDQMYNIYAPPVYNGEENVDVSNSNLFNGLTERDFVSKGIMNRQVQQVKVTGLPVSGYLNRQMLLAMMDIMFIDKEESPDNVGLLIPRSAAVGRTMMNGTKIRSKGLGNEKVRVKSCVNHIDDNDVFADEINQDQLHIKDGAAIGISFATSFMEAKTQSVLGLKHVDSLQKFEDEKIVAQRGGTVTEISDFLVISGQSGVERYKLSGNIALVGGIDIGSEVNMGDTIVISRRIQPVYYKIADLKDFFGLQVDRDSGMGREPGRGKVLCYAPKSGTIRYPSKDTMTIDGLVIKTSPNELYYYPEGYHIEKGQKFCSGLLDMGKFYEVNQNLQDNFDIMVKQIEDLFGSGTRYELFEVIFKALYKDKFKAHTKFTQTNNFMNRMFYGATKQGLSSFFKEAPEGKIGIEDSIILPLVLGLEPNL